MCSGESPVANNLVKKHATENAGTLMVSPQQLKMVN